VGSDWADIIAETPYHIGLHETMIRNLPVSLRRLRFFTGYGAGESEATPWDMEKESPESVNLRRFVPPESRHFIRDDSIPHIAFIKKSLPKGLWNLMGLFMDGIDLDRLPPYSNDSSVEDTPVDRGMITTRPRHRCNSINPGMIADDTRKAVVGDVTKEIFDNVLTRADVGEVTEQIFDNVLRRADVKEVTEQIFDNVLRKGV
jgi:hypothetical protein